MLLFWKEVFCNKPSQINGVILVLVLIRWTQSDAGSSCGRPSRRCPAGLGACWLPARSHRGHVVTHAGRGD